MSDHVPAFPLYGVTSVVQEGMSLRDYFAAKALQGAIAGSMSDGTHFALGDETTLAQMAYLLADAMMLERTK